MRRQQQQQQRQRLRGGGGGAVRGEDDLEDDEDEDPEGDGEEEEEVTRCLCKQQEYPGLPLSRREALLRSKPRDEVTAAAAGEGGKQLIPDELGSMFIQCDTCKVWQHGGCVGIMDESMSPDEYFCEQCRKDLHRVRLESNG